VNVTRKDTGIPGNETPCSRASSKVNCAGGGEAARANVDEKRIAAAAMILRIY
jgi:hypothetical protein